MSRPKVLHILSTAQPEGTGIIKLVTAMARAVGDGYQQTAWFLLSDGPLAADFHRINIETQFVPWRPSPRDPAGALRFMRALRRERPAIIHQHFGGTHLRRVARLAGDVRILAHFYARTAEFRHPTPVQLPTARADRAVAYAHAVARCGWPGPVEVIPPPFDAPEHGVQPPAQNAGELVIGTAGRLAPLKAIDILVRAVARLRDEFPQVRLEIAGSGPEEPYLLDEARRLGIADRVSFLGWHSDLAPFWGRWHVYAHPSRTEGTSLSILEAMAFGVPVVAARSGGTPEIVDEGVTGLLVEVDDVPEMAAALSSLLRNPAQRAHLGAAGRDRVLRCYAPAITSARIRDIYDQLLRSRDGA